MTQDAIVVQNVTKTFRIRRVGGINIKSRKTGTMPSTPKFIRALDDVSFSISKGESVSVIGLNGSGKTTLLRTIAGIYQPGSGSIKVEGRMAPMLQLGSGFQDELAAADNITMYGMLLGFTKEEIEGKIELILKNAGLKNFADMKIKNYSSGMRSRLGFSTALQIDPDVLLIDEIFAVGDRLFREKSYDFLTTFKNKGKTILHSTHNLTKIQESSDRVLLMHQGRLIESGRPEDVIEKYKQLKNS